MLMSIALFKFSYYNDFGARLIINHYLATKIKRSPPHDTYAEGQDTMFFICFLLLEAHKD